MVSKQALSFGNKIFIDTSAWISYFGSDQPKHINIKSLIKQFTKDGVVISTSNDVIDETVTRLIYDTNIKIVKKFTNLIRNSIKHNSLVQLWVDEQIQGEAFEIVDKFSEHKLSLTDATSIVLINRFNIDTVISLDSDFKKVGIKTLP
ncbi:type II toxin-antitoxin system VapC family toxin [Candidatus Daviesbacteria bacterium]|nr:type II toxin-antitoxin system VapC family toxin [Candidatus Daviesbacteria bacterium]